MKYLVLVTRDRIESAAVEVEAESPAEAADYAMDKAECEDVDWELNDAGEYTVYLGSGVEDDVTEEGENAAIRDGTTVEVIQGISYHQLHDGLSDMIESGRLTEEAIPDDYQWLVEALASLAVQPENQARETDLGS